MTIAQRILEIADSFGQGKCLDVELMDMGGTIIDSSEWSSNYTPVPWKFWEFQDRSQLFVKDSGRFPYLRAY